MVIYFNEVVRVKTDPKLDEIDLTFDTYLLLANDLVLNSFLKKSNFENIHNSISDQFYGCHHLSISQFKHFHARPRILRAFP